MSDAQEIIFIVEDDSEGGLTARALGESIFTVPNHEPIKLGTLSAILTEVARALNVPRDELIRRL
jgi:hypothetical protein